MPGFLIEYNRRTGDSHVTSYDGHNGYREAFNERIRLEQLHRDPDIEIVSLAGDSLETIRRTHRRYFIREEAQLPT